MKWTIRLIDAAGADRFILLNAEGATWETGPCAKLLALEAFAQGAQTVAHDYDLKRDDCAGHTLARVGP